MNQKYKALREGNWLDFFQEDNPICPHCGTEVSIHDNELWELYNPDKDHVITCGDCGGKFTVEVEATYTFSTHNQEDDDDGTDEENVPAWAGA